jgi:hypothetical protein
LKIEIKPPSSIVETKITHGKQNVFLNIWETFLLSDRKRFSATFSRWPNVEAFE